MSRYYQGPVSDHFDGELFFNPLSSSKQQSTQQRARFGLLRWNLDRRFGSGRRAKWPARAPSPYEDRPPQRVDGSAVRLSYVGHASFLLQTAGRNILTDPVWSERASPFRWIGPKRVRKPGIELTALPRIDVLLLSHNHYDHLDVDTLRSLAMRFSPLTLVPVGNVGLVRSTGLRNVYELDWWEKMQMGTDLKFVFAPTQHFAARNLLDRQKSLWGSFAIRSNGRLLYFGGDAGYSSHFREIKKKLGAPDIALLGMGAYEPRWFMKSMHMNPEEAVQAHLDLSARKTIGMHFGTFRLTTESFDSPKADLRNALEKLGVLADAFITLNEGETGVF